MKTLKKTNLYFTFLFLIFSTTGCITYKDVEMVKVVDVGIKDMTTKGVEVEVAMQIKNPNKYNITIVDSDLEIFVQGNRLATARIYKKLILEKKSNKIYRFTIKSTLKDMGSNVFPILLKVMGGGTINLQVKGDFKAKVKGVGKRFPIDIKEKVTL